VGNIPQVAVGGGLSKLFERQQEWHEKYGPIVRFTLVPGTFMVSVNDVESIKKVVTPRSDTIGIYGLRKIPLSISFALHGQIL
jgi:hypothetical protein